MSSFHYAKIENKFNKFINQFKYFQAGKGDSEAERVSPGKDSADRKVQRQIANLKHRLTHMRRGCKK